MIKIPNENKKYSQTNNSDLSGNIWYTKNINFDEKGYLKQSPRVISIKDSKNDTDFNLVSGLGRYTTGNFYVATKENPYILDIDDDALTLCQKDSGSSVPTTSTSTFGMWWNGLWHITTSTKIFTKATSGTWTDRGGSLTSGIKHPMCVFEKANTILIGNGNAVKQLDSSYSAGTLAQLTISSDYEINAIAYNNNYAGISTKLSETVDGENKEAGFFIWDGSASSANNMYGSGSDMILGVAPYRSSFVILTREGQLKYFNGGGFEVLASFPVYFKNVDWNNAFGNPLGSGDIIKVKGDNIYINIENSIIDTGLNTTLENMVGGVWCYDPEIGLYHKYSPSLSSGSIGASRQADVDTTRNTFTIYSIASYPTPFVIPDTGNPVKVLNSVIDEIKEGQILYIIKVSSTEFKLASSYENAIALTPIDLVNSNSGTNFFLMLNTKDYSQHKTRASGSVAFWGDKARVYDDILFGSTLNDTNSTNTYAHLNFSVSGFKNISYYITPRIQSGQIEDNIIKGFIKYKPLKDTDEIIIKYKNKDYLGIPEYADCTATSNTVLTTISLISKSYDFAQNSYFNQAGLGRELECEVISGAGGGQMVKVSSITYLSGTYTITLAEALEGVSVSDLLSIKLDNWNVLETITSSDDNNWKEFSIAKSSKFTQFKVILSGSDITIEELQIINNNHIPSK